MRDEYLEEEARLVRLTDKVLRHHNKSPALYTVQVLLLIILCSKKMYTNHHFISHFITHQKVKA